jgi:hypothetical protein
VSGEQVDVFDLDRRSMRNELFPIPLRWITDRRSDNPKVRRAFVGADIEQTAAVLDVVLVIRFPP